MLSLLLMLDAMLVAMLGTLRREQAGLSARDRRWRVLEERIAVLEGWRDVCAALLVRVLAARRFAAFGGGLRLRGLYGRLRKVLRALVTRIGEARRAVLARADGRRMRPRRAARVARRRRPTDKVTQKTVRAAAMTRVL